MENKILLEKGFQIGDYIIEKLIGKGGFGDIYLIKNLINNNNYAIKIDFKKQLTLREISFLKNLQGSPMFPKIFLVGEKENFNFFIMELLGQSLEKVKRNFPNKKISLELSLQIGIYMLKCIQQLHSKGIIHRDIKPSNFLIRLDSLYPLVLIDFGLASRYIDLESGVHLDPRNDRNFAGTSIYASLNALTGQDISRKDDLFSWFFSLIDLIKGKLPWKNLINEELIKFRKKLNIKNLCENLPIEFLKIYNLINNLKFEENPDYNQIINLLHNSLNNLNIQFSKFLPNDLILNKNNNEIIKSSSFTNIIDSENFSNNSLKNLELNCQKKCKI